MFNLAAHVLTAGAQTPDKVALAVLGLTGAERWSYARLIGAVRGCGIGWPHGRRRGIESFCGWATARFTRRLSGGTGRRDGAGCHVAFAD